MDIGFASQWKRYARDMHASSFGHVRADDPKLRLAYLSVGLCEESAEVSFECKPMGTTPDALVELGDFCWYFASLTTELGIAVAWPTQATRRAFLERGAIYTDARLSERLCVTACVVAGEVKRLVQGRERRAMPMQEKVDRAAQIAVHLADRMTSRGLLGAMEANREKLVKVYGPKYGFDLERVRASDAEKAGRA